MNSFKTILLTIISAYLAIFSLAFFFSDKFIFFPPPPGYQDDESIIKLKTPDGALISAIYLPNSKAEYTFLVNHGNAEDLGYMWNFLKLLHEQGFSVFAYDYHGYGTSQGSPNESNSYDDALAAYNYLTQNLQIEPQKIILYGRSLGAALALHVASREPAAALIMEAPFISAYRVLTRFPILPFDQFNNLPKIKKLKIPLLIIHGGRDMIVSAWQSRKLYKAAPAVNKRYYFVPKANHDNILLHAKEEYWQTIEMFVRSIKK